MLSAQIGRDLSCPCYRRTRRSIPTAHICERERRCAFDVLAEGADDRCRDLSTAPKCIRGLRITRTTNNKMSNYPSLTINDEDTVTTYGCEKHGFVCYQVDDQTLRRSYNNSELAVVVCPAQFKEVNDAVWGRSFQCNGVSAEAVNVLRR